MNFFTILFYWFFIGFLVFFIKFSTRLNEINEGVEKICQEIYKEAYEEGHIIKPWAFKLVYLIAIVSVIIMWPRFVYGFIKKIIKTK